MTDQPGVSEDWKQCSDLTIYEAAFWVRLKFDPRKHAYRCELDDAYYDSFMQHHGGYEAVIEKCDVILSAVRSGFIKTTKEVHTPDGSLNCNQTYISKSDWLAWCGNNELHDLLVRFGYSQDTSVCVSPADKSDALSDVGASPSEPMNNIELDQARLEREYRGCKRHIIEHWPQVQKTKGPDADGVQVHQYLKTVLMRDELPSLKTVRNCLIELRKEKVLP